MWPCGEIGRNAVDLKSTTLEVNTVGSIPSTATIQVCYADIQTVGLLELKNGHPINRDCYAAEVHMGERLSCKENEVGSIPTSGSNLCLTKAYVFSIVIL